MLENKYFDQAFLLEFYKKGKGWDKNLRQIFYEKMENILYVRKETDIFLDAILSSELIFEDFSLLLVISQIDCENNYQS